MRSKSDRPKVLFVDIETAPILAHVWRIWDENIGLNQIKADWSIIAWSAKWRGSSKLMYRDLRDAKNIEDDSKLLREIWALIDEADIIVTQNGKRFDQPKLNARFIMNGLKPPRYPKHLDTREIAKRKFGFTSNKLEYMTEKLNKKYKKIVHRGDYSGFELWKACLSGDKKAWSVMEKYNKHDVLALEELFEKLLPWDSSINFDVYCDDETWHCSCGSTEFRKRGFFYTAAGKYQRYKCETCGVETRSAANLFSKEKKASLRRPVR